MGDEGISNAENNVGSSSSSQIANSIAGAAESTEPGYVVFGGNVGKALVATPSKSSSDVVTSKTSTNASSRVAAEDVIKSSADEVDIVENEIPMAATEVTIEHSDDTGIAPGVTAALMVSALTGGIAYAVKKRRKDAVTK